MKVSLTGAILATAASLLLSPAAVQATNYTDVDILNFALNLECLEAEFYSWVAYGQGIYSVNSSLVGSNSNLTASSSEAVAATWLSTDPYGAELAAEIAENEIAHVNFLRSALGSAAVPCPSLSLSATTFTAAASAAAAALGTTLTSGSTLDPYTSADSTDFYLAAFIFEDVGVTAYKGAIQNLQSSTYAAVAAGIMAVEAGHAAVIRSQLYNSIGYSTDTTILTGTSGTAIDVATAVKGITTLRDNLGGTSSSSVENILTRTSAAHGTLTAATDQPDLFAADSNGVAYSRTPTQVLDIVYFSTNTTPGGFLPYGVAGNADVLEITGTSSKTCASGALSMASLSVMSAAVVAVAAVLAL